MSRVYLITNTANGKIYVGQTERPLEERWKMHWSYSPNKRLFNDILEYGKGSFTIETLCVCPSQAAADIAERFFIYFLGARKKSLGYNINAGGASQHRNYFGPAEAKAEEIIENKKKSLSKAKFREWTDYKLFKLPEHERLTYEKVLRKRGYIWK